MALIPAKSENASRGLSLVSGLQDRFVQKLEKLAESYLDNAKFKKVEWLRDAGTHGGGYRFEAPCGDFFNRGSVNVSQVHYDDNPEKKLGSASAISTIIHPTHPLMPSIHIHISYTEMKDKSYYFRIMADLNPSHFDDESKTEFLEALQNLSADQFKVGNEQGDKYFFIPGLKMHRGVAHYYLEKYVTGSKDSDFEFAQNFGEGIIDCYVEILKRLSDSLDFDLTKVPYHKKLARLTGSAKTSSDSSQMKINQIAYHTAYFLQVLLLDRGTTTGLIIHDQNDPGIMGSLPAIIDLNLLKEWASNHEHPQDKLISSLAEACEGHRITDAEKVPKNLIDEFEKLSLVAVEEPLKLKICQRIRAFYKEHKDALDLQASGFTVPPTVANHL